MRDLIRALTILAEYTPEAATSCEHNVLYVHVDPFIVADTDQARLYELGFHPHVLGQNFYSFRFGSA